MPDRPPTAPAPDPSDPALVPEPVPPDRPQQPGWREVAVIAAGIVVVVLAVATLTLAIPALRDAVARLPLLILVFIGGTALVVWRILRAPSARP